MNDKYEAEIKNLKTQNEELKALIEHDGKYILRNGKYMTRIDFNTRKYEIIIFNIIMNFTIKRIIYNRMTKANKFITQPGAIVLFGKKSKLNSEHYKLIELTSDDCLVLYYYKPWMSDIAETDN